MSSVRPESSRRAPPDGAQRRRITTELQRSLLVEAGAGSGKTQKLAERMAAGIASGDYELERMAAVTFTRKAAAELRGRFQAALEARLVDAAEGVDADAAAVRIRGALSNLERFFAGTIHAFCARLLRERPVEAGVSPGFIELDEIEEAALREQSWRDYRTQARAAGDHELLELLDAGITARLLDKAFEVVCTYEDVTFPAGDAPPPDTASALAALERFWSTLEPTLPDPIPDGSTCKTQERAGRFARQWRARGRGRRDAGYVADLMRCWESTPKVTQRDWSSAVAAKEALRLCEDFRAATVLPFLAAWRAYIYRRCVGVLTRARDAARLERRRRNALSFSDLLIVTADVLRRNAGVRRALQQKYRWLFVDEFQDTDPIQAEIMMLLAADEGNEAAQGGSRAPADWRTVPIRPGALFVVGDPKQSIFRFRRADIDIYNEVRARLGGPGGRDIVRLTTNFRSVPALCEWANEIFRRRFPASPTPESPMFAPLEPFRTTEKGRPGLAVIDLPATIDSRDLAVEEARRIARYIRTEVDRGRRSFDDFLILTRKKRSLRPYADALEALQVPIEVTGAGAFGESPEVRELALLLKALSDPQDGVALVGVLRGALFGLSDRDLFAFRQAGGSFGVFGGDELKAGPGGGAARVAGALSTLRQWHVWTRMLPAGAALERILEASGYLALAAASPGGVDAGDLLHAVDRIRRVVERGFTLAAAAEALGRWCGLDAAEAEDSTEVDSLPLEPGRRDVVRLMNLHKAKGLEADVVFLADPLGGFEPRVDVRVVRRSPGSRRSEPEALGYFSVEAESEGRRRPRVLAQPPDWAAQQAAEKAYVDAEVDRLLYVAATRARDLLVIGRYGGRAGQRKPAWDVLLAGAGDAPVLEIPDAVSLPMSEGVDLSIGAAAGAAARAAAMHDAARRPSWIATSVTAEARRLPRILAEPVDAVDAAAADPTRAVVPDTASHRADAGLAWGTLIHGLLEHAMRFPQATRGDLRRLAMWLTMEEPALRAVVDQALDTVAWVARAGFWREARASVERHEEVPFAIRESDAGRPHVISGAIDLVYRHVDGWRVVDYKTDVSHDPGTRAVYEHQLATYQQAWVRFGGTTTVRLVEARTRSGGDE